MKKKIFFCKETRVRGIESKINPINSQWTDLKFIVKNGYSYERGEGAVRTTRTENGSDRIDVTRERHK